MFNSKEILPIFKEAYAAHVILISVGVPYENIYVIPNIVSDGKEYLGVQAIQGDLKYTVVVGLLEMSIDEFCKSWPEAAKAINKLPAQTKKDIVESTNIIKQAVEILTNMVMKGFRRT